MTEAAATVRTLRRLLLALVILGCLGYLTELFLLEHFESTTQLIPFVALAAALASAVAQALAPTRTTVRIFQAAMAALVATAFAGLYFHYDGNLAFEREMDASARGLALVWQTVRGATPALAPGSLAQLGLLGLIQAFRHPACMGGGEHAQHTHFPDERDDR